MFKKEGDIKEVVTKVETKEAGIPIRIKEEDIQKKTQELDSQKTTKEVNILDKTKEEDILAKVIRVEVTKATEAKETDTNHTSLRTSQLQWVNWTITWNQATMSNWMRMW